MDFFGFIIPSDYDYIHQVCGRKCSRKSFFCLWYCITEPDRLVPAGVCVNRSNRATFPSRHRKRSWPYLGSPIGQPDQAAYEETRETKCYDVFPYSTVGPLTGTFWIYLLMTMMNFSQESYSDADVDTRTNKPLDVGIHGEEQPGSSKTNGGFFENGLQKALESDDVAAGDNLEVKVVGNGHCHSKIRVYIHRVHIH
jgi:hypothetical protein